MNDLEPTNSGKKFETIRRIDPDGKEFWFASELMNSLGYERWDRFLELIERAKSAAYKSGFNPEDHFSVLGRMVSIGSGAKRMVADYVLTRYACYLIAQNGDPRRKQEIALAQSYFAFQTRNQEIQQEGITGLERILARQKLSETEKKFAGVLFDKGIDGKGVATIRALGDEALFGGKTTQDMKDKLGVKGKRPLADFLPTITLKAKDLATEMTTFKTKENNLKNGAKIKDIHVNHNKGVRKALTDEDIFPESLPAAEDIKKLERRIKKEDKKLKL